ncbi:MAG: hypothetical protein ACLGGX_08470 [Bdellovibrionia bacterium]
MKALWVTTIFFVVFSSALPFAQSESCKKLIVDNTLGSLFAEIKVSEHLLTHFKDVDSASDREIETYKKDVKNRTNSCTGKCLESVAFYFLKQGYIQEALWVLAAERPSRKAEEIITFLQKIFETEPIIFADPAIQNSLPYTYNSVRLGYIAGIKVIIKNHKLANGYIAETWAYELDRTLGLNIVPLTVFRSAPQPISIQLFLPDSKISNIEFKDTGYWNHVEYPEIFLLDYILLQWDRHGRNSLFTPSGRLAAIDNDMVEGVYMTGAWKMIGHALDRNFDHQKFQLTKKTKDTILNLHKNEFIKRMEKVAPPEIIDFHYERIQKVRVGL